MSKNKGRRHFWTEEMDKILIENYPKVGYEGLIPIMMEKYGYVFKKTTIDHKVVALGLGKKRYWTEEMEKVLKENYSELDINEMVNLMEEKFNQNFSKLSIFRKAFNLGLKSSNRPHYRHPIGMEIDDGKYIKVKVSDIPYEDKVEYRNNNWKRKRYIVWEQAYGKVPDDYCIIFLDGDYHNCALSNLRCIPQNYPVKMIKQLANNIFKEGPEILEAGIAWCELSDAIKEAKDK